MKVLVIGGSRFTGRYLVEELVKQEHDVSVLNRGISDKKIDAPFIKQQKFDYPKGVNTIKGDRREEKILQEKVSGKGFEAIIDTCGYNELDIQKILNLKLEKLANYIFVSTASVYDEEKVKILPIAEESDFGSLADDCPIPYSRDKRRAEKLLDESYKKNSFPITIFRPTYIFGPFNPIYREAYFFDRIRDRQPILMPGNGEYLIDFVFNKDLALLLTLPLEKKKAIGKKYNATGEGGLTLNNYTNILEKIIGNEAEVIHFDPKIIEENKLKPENRNQYFPFSFDMHFILNKEKAVKELNYKATNFEIAMDITYNWYSKNKNPDWIGDYDFDVKLSSVIKNNI